MKTLVLLVLASFVLPPLVLAEEGEKNIFPRTLKLGDYGEDVSTLQNFLRVRGYFHLPPKWKTGYFGPITDGALKAYQRNNRLPETGVMDEDTRDRILWHLGIIKDPPQRKPAKPQRLQDSEQLLATHAPPEVREVVFLI